MLNRAKVGLKTVVDNLGKQSKGIKVLYGAISAAAGLYVANCTVNYYKDATRDNTESRAKTISQYMVHKEYDSVRYKDVELIKKRLTLKPNEIRNKFSVLVGPRGIGKTVAIQSAAENLKGIITIGPIKPGTSQNEIMNEVCYEITGRQGSYIENKQFMKSVIDLYRRRTGNVPVIIIGASQRPLNEKPAQLTAAARILVDNFGVNVFIDCSENALADTPRTGREYMIELEPMSWDMMRQLPEFKDLFKMLKAQGNEEVVLAICGGSPLLLKDLDDRIMTIANENDEKKSSVVRQFVTYQVSVAKNDIKLLIHRCPKMKEVLKMFEGKEDSKITYDMLLDSIENVELPDLKGVLRKVTRLYDNELKVFLTAANGAIDILLRMGSLDRAPNFDEIKTTISKWSKQKENENDIDEKKQK